VRDHNFYEVYFLCGLFPLAEAGWKKFSVVNKPKIYIVITNRKNPSFCFAFVTLLTRQELPRAEKVKILEDFLKAFEPL